MDISVLMSVYFKENPEYLRLSLDSIFSQTKKAAQVVLVEDGELTPELDEVIKEYQERFSELEIVPLSKNGGLSNALNIGLQYCRYDVVARMDTDDICYSHRFQKQVEEFEKDEALDIVGAYATMIDENGNELKQITVPLTNEDIARKVWTCPFIHPTVMFKKTSLLIIGSYNPNSGPRQDDYELWFRCVENGLKCMNISEPLLYYRFFKDSVARNNLKVGWHRAKVGIKGSWRCKCPLIAYIGVCYPLVRACMPSFVRMLMYKVADRMNPRTNKG